MMAFKHGLRRHLIAPALLTAMFALFLQLQADTWLDALIGDARFSADQRKPSGQIVLVDIDAKSLAEVGIWPWPRRIHGDLVAAANRYGAANIAFDVDFSTSSNPYDDQLFADALSKSVGSTFLAAFVQRRSADNDAFLLSQPIDALGQVSWPALVNVEAQRDGLVRTFPYSLEHDGEQLSSMPAALANRSAADSFGIDWSIDARQLPRISYVDLLKSRLAPGSLKDKTLIVGATAIELHDLFNVPLHGVVSGSTVIAMATETLSQSRPLIAITIPVAVLAPLLIVLFISLRRLPLRTALMVLSTVAIATELVSFAAYALHGWVFSTGSLQLALGLVAVGLAVQQLGVRRLMLWIARTELRNKETILARVVEDGFDGVILLDHTGRVIISNRHADILLDVGRRPLRSAEDLPGKLIDLMRSAEEFPAICLERFETGEGVRVVEYSLSKVKTAETSGDLAASAGLTREVTCIAIRDVTAREQATEHMRFLAMNDSLTGLPNRRALEDRLEIMMGDRKNAPEICLVSFDLDRFKLVNDTLGHAVGDGVLCEVGRRAVAVLDGAFVARLGGDEFFAIVEAAACKKAVAALTSAVASPMLIAGATVTVGVSVGIAHAQSVTTAEDLIRHADLALYRAKTGMAVATFDLSMEAERLERLELERDLSTALSNRQFRVAFQPQVDLTTSEITGAEALLRWEHPTKGMVSPARFIPVAEDMGLVSALGEWVLKEACTLAAEWGRPLKVAVNVSPLQFAVGGLPKTVRSALEESGLPASRLELEITESLFVQDSATLAGTFDELLKLGVTFALDDFGTGYSSLGYLHRFPISKVKIDQSFTREIGRSTSVLAVLRAVRVLAAGLDIQTIAEGIETAEQASFLKELGYEQGQGYLFSKPVSADAFLELISKSQIAA